MPIYEYECQSCGHRIEALQKLADPPLTTCEICEGELKKLVSSPAFQFKGSGWYVTDYARKGGDQGAGAERGSKEKDSGDGGTAVAETKTAKESKSDTGSSSGSESSSD